jgi:hypothetical protein
VRREEETGKQVEKPFGLADEELLTKNSGRLDAVRTFYRRSPGLGRQLAVAVREQQVKVTETVRADSPGINFRFAGPEQPTQSSG